MGDRSEAALSLVRELLDADRSEAQQCMDELMRMLGVRSYPRLLYEIADLRMRQEAAIRGCRETVSKWFICSGNDDVGESPSEVKACHAALMAEQASINRIARDRR